MKSLNIILPAVTVALTLKADTSDAFTPFHFSGRPGRNTSPPLERTEVSRPSLTILRSTPFDNATPNDQIIIEEYGKWRMKYNKGDYDPVRYENFKANFMAVTVRNNMERARARQNGEAAPSPIALNEYGDCSADEYRAAMGQQQQQGYNNSGAARRMTSANTRPAVANNQGLQPSNTIINTPTTTNTNNSARRMEGMANASAQLRSAVQQRISMENELQEMKKVLEQKQKLLAQASKAEQDCQERLALREEQKRILNDRLNNGWEDEGGMNNWY